MSRRHELKCWPEPFSAILDGSKTFEFRYDDRGFAVGDVLELQEWDPHTRYAVGPEYRRAEVEVTYLLRGAFGVPEGFVVMGIRPVSARGAVQDEQPCAPMWHEGDSVPVAACIACAHVLPMGAWDARSPWTGICAECLRLAAPNRGSCSHSRGCDCTQGGVSWRIRDAEQSEPASDVLSAAPASSGSREPDDLLGGCTEGAGAPRSATPSAGTVTGASAAPDPGGSHDGPAPSPSRSLTANQPRRHRMAPETDPQIDPNVEDLAGRTVESASIDERKTVTITFSDGAVLQAPASTLTVEFG